MVWQCLIGINYSPSWMVILHNTSMFRLKEIHLKYLGLVGERSTCYYSGEILYGNG